MKNFSPVQYRQMGLRSSFAQPQEPIPTIKKVYPQSSHQSPYNFSPNRGVSFSLAASTDELELYKQRCWDLEKQMLALKSETQLQKALNVKSADLEGKVIEVVEQNSTLQNQLDKASKQVNQKRNESDIWKQRYEAQIFQLTKMKGNYEQEIKQLALELQHISNKIGSAELDKNRHISDSKALHEAQSQVHLENIKKSQFNQLETYEAQLKKMRDIIEDKTIQITQLQTLLERHKSENQDIQLRTRNEVDIGKNRISSQQIDHQNELEIQRTKLELNKETQFRNAQYAHNNQADILQSDIDKLKNLLDIKNIEIETLLMQNQKQRISYDLDYNNQRLEIEDLKYKLLENEKYHQQENNNIQISLETMHNMEVTSLKVNNNQSNTTLLQEIHQLKDIIHSKNKEIEKQILDKTQQKEYYDSEIQRLINTIEDGKRKVQILSEISQYMLLDLERNKQGSDLIQRIDRLNQQNIDQQQEAQKQMNVLEYELVNMKSLVQHKNQEIENNMKNFQEIKLDLEQCIIDSRQEIQQFQNQSQDIEQNNLQEINDLKMFLTEQEQISKERIKSLDITIDHLKYDISKVTDMYNNKCKECENLINQKLHSDNQQRKFQDQNDELIDKINDFERYKNVEIDELRARMDSQAIYQFENLKKAYNTQVNILSDQISDLQIHLQTQQQEYSDLLQRYSILDRSLLPEELVKKNMYNSRNGIPAEYIANKAIHDVLVKSSIRSGSLHRQ